MMHTKYLLTFLFTTAFSLSACGTSHNNRPNNSSLPTKTLITTTLFSSSNCNINEQGITEVTDELALQSIINKAYSHMLNTKPTTIPPINFKSSMIYLIALGSKPNTGYALKSLGKEASYEHGVLSLPLKVQHPSKEGMYAQMMTSPCTLISVPSGIYKQINIQGWEYFLQE